MPEEPPPPDPLIEKAREGKKVVRLKGGDPFVFGRGGEEAEALVAAGISFEVVPGVTSAVAVPAYAGIPLTHRRVSSSFTVVSGSEDPAKGASSVHWGEVATGAGTLVVLMAWESLPHIVEALMSQGMPGSTPVALIRWGTEPYQVTVVGTLADIVEKGKEAGLEPPVVAVIGEVVRLRERLRWFDNKPLFGKKVLVTRSRQQASVLSRLLAEEGAEVVELATIKIEPSEDLSPLDRALQQLSSYQWAVFTIGPATAQALASYGINADLVPQVYLAEAVVEAMRPHLKKGGVVLLPRSAEGREALAEGLTKAGARVECLPLYRPGLPKAGERETRELVARVDAVTFTSSSTVRNLIGLLGGDKGPLEGKTIVCIGPVTAQAARELGLDVQVTAKRYDIQGLVEALREFFGGKEG
jgi:uroporphyrinogen III methyltransferase/synthase